MKAGGLSDKALMHNRMKNRIIAAIVASLTILFFYTNIADYINLYTRLKTNPKFGSDFGVVYNVVDMIRQGNHNLYDAEAATENGKRIGLPPATAVNYPPFVFLMYMPYSVFSLRDAINVLFLLNHVFLFLSVYIILLSLDIKSLKISAACTLVFMMSGPFIDTLFAGQINTMILLFISLFMYFHDKRKKTVAAVFLGLASAVKIIPAILIIPLIAKKDYKTAAASILSTVLFTFLPVSVFGTGIINQYLHVNDRLLSVSYGYNNQAISAFFIKFFTENDQYVPIYANKTFAMLATMTVVSAVIVLSFALAGKKAGEERSRISDYLSFSAFLIVGILVFAFSWPHHSLWLIPGIIYGFYYLLKVELNRPVLYSFACTVFLQIVLIGEVSARSRIFFVKNALLLYSSGMFLNLAVLGFLLYLIHRCSRSENSNNPAA